MTTYSHASRFYDQAVADLDGEGAVLARLARAAKTLREMPQLALPPSELWREHMELLHDASRCEELTAEEGDQVATQIRSLADRIRPPLGGMDVGG
ncbi:MAG: hypothetical protein AB7T63_05365 [Planctomycetota bacterium]